ncbi:MAG: T9SS type A sorting domain-containing protein [Bacteroidales bacterium]|nr:T9SS type A sorting domain-containing protein [Bacteroidales bacterium]
MSDVSWGDYNNDGYLDFVIMGLNEDFERIVKVYKNNGNGNFEVQDQFVFTGVQAGSIDWGDFNNDGFLDLIFNGQYFVESATTLETTIYTNNGGNSFSELLNQNFKETTWGEADWGDINNDGYLDFVLTGWVQSKGEVSTTLYLNNTNETFSQMVDSLTHVGYGSTSWGDYDNDLDLDLLLTGLYASSAETSEIYKNNETTPNFRPNVIINLQTEIIGNDVTFSWDEATDNNQPSAGLNYNIYVYEEGNDSTYIASPQAFPYNHPLNGKRLIAKRGQIQGVRQDGRVSYMLKGVFEECKTYYWSVQAIDASFVGGEFAPEQFFKLPDIIFPEIECRTDTTIILLEEETLYIAGTEFDLLNYSDNCDSVSIINNYNNADSLVGETFPIGTTTVTWTVTDEAGNQTQCSFDVEIKEFVGVDELTENEILIYPNPADDVITIKVLDSYSKEYQISIYNFNGEKIYSEEVCSNDFKIQTQLFSIGLYLCVISQNGQIISSEKFIVEH